jgi:nucleotide-binding universal stress UspA family protein
MGHAICVAIDNSQPSQVALCWALRNALLSDEEEIDILTVRTPAGV